MSIINDDQFVNQQIAGNLIGSNCITPYGCSTYYPQPVLHLPKQLTVEAVDGGYIISGTHQGKGSFRTVALDAQGLAAIVKNWATQFECKTK
jgi:hypothetical protein